MGQGAKNETERSRATHITSSKRASAGSGILAASLVNTPASLVTSSASLVNTPAFAPLRRAHPHAQQWMELGQTQRPRAPVESFQDYEPRRKCTVCCGLRCAALAGSATFCVSLVCNAFVLGGRVTDGRGWRGFLNRNGLIALPVAAITFTHQVLLSESLWSKNKKTVIQVNTQSALLNMSLWTCGTASCTAVSRRFLPARSRAYRLALWEYQRTRRGCANPWMPTVFGRVTEDLDWYNVMWTLTMYHVLWGMVSVMLEKELGAHYAMFYRNGQYSRWCSPRWREWRELEVIRLVNTEQVVAPNRWGTFITNDKWRTRNF